MPNYSSLAQMRLNEYLLVSRMSHRLKPSSSFNGIIIVV